MDNEIDFSEVWDQDILPTIEKLRFDYETYLGNIAQGEYSLNVQYTLSDMAYTIAQWEMEATRRGMSVPDWPMEDC
jgi:hypothetical protein